MNLVEPIRDKDDIQAMKDYLKEWNDRNYMLFMVGINSGFRISDIVKLKVKDVQGWHFKIKEQKTGKTIRRKMPRPLKNELARYIEGKPLHHYLFQSRKGKNQPITRQAAYLIIKTAAEDLGIENVGTHTMRKTFGYHYYEKYKDVASLMEMFNHASPAITLRYIGKRQEQLDLSMAKFSL
ncbi:MULTISPECIES: site-specific integrase [unclassified Streptococcus]|uniref:site-specific integrase n=1 Tax=unclassified Streptococcus TaxID=2608887 RepID=UPI00211B5C98|nr:MULTISPECIES: site-specific integrase [unclassified Streptococcus]MCQ9211646.1 site-specific integrase [Streptococcus sp. B01]MCQ9213163.1 site-specific integrase [Streptococcus sp. O1]MCQ9214951.1 site-specific integrase [Streptococcus sp. O1]MCQ9215085.1 site-specific integrase [Streptococcus sp. O1]